MKRHEFPSNYNRVNFIFFAGVFFLIILFYRGLSAAPASLITENEKIIEEMETLKFRINELTRELALMKTAMMKISSLEKQLSGGRKMDTDNYSYPSNSGNQPKSGRNIQAKQTARQDNSKGKNRLDKENNYLEIINNKSKNIKSEDENSEIVPQIKENEKYRKRLNSKKNGQAISLNLVFESKIEFNKPVSFNLLLRELKYKKPVVSFIFSQFMMFNKSKSALNTNLVSKKNKSEFSDSGQSTGKFSFTVSNLNTLKTEVLVFDDTNGNLIADDNEPSVRRLIEQTVLLED